MGCGGSSEKEDTEEAKEQKVTNKTVTKELNDARQDEEKIIKLLLLGAGGSGKSTLFKQLQFIHTNGFAAKQRRMFQNQIYEQCIESLKTLIQKCEEYYEDDPEEYKQYKLYDYDNEDDEKDDIRSTATYILTLSANQKLTPDVTKQLKKMWANETIQKMFAIRNEICVPDSTEYYYKDLDRISAEDYVPNDQDLLLVRYRTTGIQEKFFVIKENKFLICDVGGQRNERKKWIHFFDNVTAVIFVVALSCYDELTFENEDNSMDESIMVYDQQVNSDVFKDTAFILFLNKSDLFEDKIKRVPITECKAFKDYSGDKTDYNQNLAFIKSHFEKVNKNKTRDVFQHITCATNKDNIQKVFNDVQTMIISASLAETGLG